MAQEDIEARHHPTEAAPRSKEGNYRRGLEDPGSHTQATTEAMSELQKSPGLIGWETEIFTERCEGFKGTPFEDLIEASSTSRRLYAC